MVFQELRVHQVNLEKQDLLEEMVYRVYQERPEKKEILVDGV